MLAMNCRRRLSAQLLRVRQLAFLLDDGGLLTSFYGYFCFIFSFLVAFTLHIVFAHIITCLRNSTPLM